MAGGLHPRGADRASGLLDGPPEAGPSAPYRDALAETLEADITGRAIEVGEHGNNNDDRLAWAQATAAREELASIEETDPTEARYEAARGSLKRAGGVGGHRGGRELPRPTRQSLRRETVAANPTGFEIVWLDTPESGGATLSVRAGRGLDINKAKAGARSVELA